VRGKRFKRYQILDKIGSGCMATVYLAREIPTGRLVALKLMHPHLADSHRGTRRLCLVFSRGQKKMITVETPESASPVQDSRLWACVREEHA
jgi:serine/threonine protein kinase